MAENIKNSLSEEELNTVLQFSQGLYGLGFGANSGLGYFATPFTQNQNLIDLNGVSAKPTYESLLSTLENSPYDYKKLASYSEFMKMWDSIYAKTLRYFSGLLSFDLSYTCKNIKDPKDYQSKEYLDDVKRVNKFLDNFDYKLEFKKVLDIILTRETAYTWFRDTYEIDSPIDIEDGKIKKNEKFSLQIMPQDYCILTGYFNNSQLLYDIDLEYFMNAFVDINLFAPAIKKMFKESFKDGNGKYVPSAQLNQRNGRYGNYCQCNPNDGAYAFKFDISNFKQVPPFISILKSCLNNDTIEKLQKDKDMISAYLLLAGEIKTMTDSKSGNKANQFAIDPKTMGQFMNLVKSGMENKVKPMALPLEDIKGWQFNDTNPSMANNQLVKASAQGASASSLIYTTDKMAQFEMENAIYADYNFIKPIYEQFNQFLNFFINKKTVKYKFEFSLDGLDRQWDREKRQSALRNYADKGIVLDPTMWASALGMKPQAFQRSLECAHNSNFIDNLTLMLNANTMKDGSGIDGENPTGAPKKQITERSEKTEEVGDYVN